MKVEAGDPEAKPTQMSREEAYRTLGVPENTKFDDVLKVKKRLVEEFSTDRDKLSEVLGPFLVAWQGLNPRPCVHSETFLTARARF